MVDLNKMAGGRLQESFDRSFEKVLENLQDVNTSPTARREININIKLDQNEERNNISAVISLKEKLAPRISTVAHFAIGKNLSTNEIEVEEYGSRIHGQMSLDDRQCEQIVDGQVVDTDTGEVLEKGKVIDYRKVAQQ